MLQFAYIIQRCVNSTKFSVSFAKKVFCFLVLLSAGKSGKRDSDLFFVTFCLNLVFFM